MSTKPSTFFRVFSLVERKFPQSSQAPAWVGVARNLIWTIFNAATGTNTDYTVQTFRREAKTVKASGTIVSPSGAAFVLQEVRVRILNPGTASSTGKFTINGSDVTGATAIALDAAVGTLRTNIPTAANTGTSGQAIAFAVSGDTNGTFKGEVEVIYRPTGTFTSFV